MKTWLVFESVVILKILSFLILMQTLYLKEILFNIITHKITQELVNKSILYFSTLNKYKIENYESN